MPLFRLGPNDWCLVRSQVLIDGALVKAGGPLLQFKPPQQGDHGAVVDAVHTRWGVGRALPVTGHLFAHGSNPLIASNSATKEQFGFPGVRHGAFGHFDTGGKGVLLERPAHRIEWHAVVNQSLRSGQEARKGEVHTANGVWELQSFHVAVSYTHLTLPTKVTV